MTRMDVREKLVELLAPTSLNFEEAVYLADYLVKNGVTVQEWIPVTERLPEKGQEVLVFDTRENWTGFAWLRPDETWTALGFDFPFDLGEVTHWMPLPEPPEENDYEMQSNLQMEFKCWVR